VSFFSIVLFAVLLGYGYISEKSFIDLVIAKVQKVLKEAGVGEGQDLREP
jgi:hypothetical protein